MDPHFDNYQGLRLAWPKYIHIKNFLQVWLPGYSQDGRECIVEFKIRPGQYGIYLLTKKQGKWEIKQYEVGEPGL
jgi:hypothetical protein